VATKLGTAFTSSLERCQVISHNCQRSLEMLSFLPNRQRPSETVWLLLLGWAVLSGSGRSAALRPGFPDASSRGSPRRSVLIIDTTSSGIYYYLLIYYIGY
jgi:hypothetical protein